MLPDPPSAEEAEAFLESADFMWHQRFELVPGVFTPGVNDVGWLLWRAGITHDLSGRSVLDVGTTNGGTAFELERRGAEVVAVDVAPDWLFGVERIKEFLQSSVQFVQGTVYELPELLDREFDLVILWGVLYHLRHPLLALDRLREVCRGTLVVETAVIDGEMGELAGEPLVRFYRLDELGKDPTNWSAPTSAALRAWVSSAGFRVSDCQAWPEGAPTRSMVTAKVTAGPAEYELISYERPLEVRTVPERGEGSR